MTACNNWQRSKAELPYKNDPIANLYDIILNLEGVIHDSQNSNGFDEVCLRTIKTSARRISLVINELTVRPVPEKTP